MKPACVQLIKEMVDKKYIAIHKHNEYNLFIYNYTKQAESEHMWNEATKMCRGLILDNNMNIVARPFAKFYNYEELQGLGIKIPDLPFEVYEKLDGSLGILYFADGKPYIATRGSFDSDQAKHATKVLYNKYADKLHLLDQSKTYLFEIIYNDPEVRGNLVVDYGDTDDIFLLAVIHTESGAEDNIDDYKHIFKTANKYDSVKDYLQFRKEQDGKNREGFVIKFANNFRMKLKFEEYFKAHSVKSHLNFKVIFNAVVNENTGALRKKIEENLQEEDVIYFDEIVRTITEKYIEIEYQCCLDFQDDFDSRAEAAAYFNTCKYPAVLFNILDGKNPSQLIWKYVAKELN
jgi:RNA ligase